MLDISPSLGNRLPSGVSPYQRAIIDIARQQFGAAEVVRFPEVWGPRVVLQADTPHGTVFLKAAADANVESEVAVLRLVRSAGVPAPQVVASGADRRVPGGHWFATSAAEGVNWAITNDDLSMRAVPHIAYCLANLHAVTVDGFGPLNKAGQGTHPSWDDWILQTAEEHLESLVTHGCTTKAFGALAISTFQSYTPTIQPGSLIHADLGESETFIDPTSAVVTALVDWGGAVVGDPVYEFGRIVAGGPAGDPRPGIVLPSLLQAYVAETSITFDRIKRVLPLYRAHNAILNAEWSRRERIPWVEGLLRAADTWIRRLWLE